MVLGGSANAASPGITLNPPAAKRRGNNLKRFNGVHLQARARFWRICADLSYMCRLCSTADAKWCTGVQDPTAPLGPLCVWFCVAVFMRPNAAAEGRGLGVNPGKQPALVITKKHNE